MPTPDTALDSRIEKSLRETHEALTKSGDLIAPDQLKVYYDLFRTRFGPEVLSQIEGEQLLNLIHARPSKASLVYWLEFKNDDEFPAIFGSISGGNSLKFGLYWRKETEKWMTGSAQDQKSISTAEAIEIATRQRDQLLAAARVLGKFPKEATDVDYAKLQQQMDQLAPDVSSYAWGHKYLSLLFPDLLDDYHNPDYQKHHLIKLLVPPAKLDGTYASAGKLVRVAKAMGWPMNHLTTVLNHRNDIPIKYWRIGTKLGEGSDAQDIWPAMKSGGYAAIGWADLGDLSKLVAGDDTRDQINKLFASEYTYNASVASRKAGEVKNFVKDISVDDVVLAADGSHIRGVGRVFGAYQFDASDPEDAPHRRQVEWHACSGLNLPVSEGLRTTVYRLKEDVNILIEAEKCLLEPIMEASSANTLPAPFNRFFSSFAEADAGFELLKSTLLTLGVDAAEYAKDKRICLSLAGERKLGDQLRLNFGNWAVLTFQNLSAGENRGQYVCALNQKPASAIHPDNNHFSDAIDGQNYGLLNSPVAKLLDSAREERKAFFASLKPVAKRFAGWKAGPWAMHHNAQLLQMIFDAQLRHELLNNGMNLEANPPGGTKLPAALNTILYGPPGTGKTFKLRNDYSELFTDRKTALTVEERALALVKDLAWWEVIALALVDSPSNQASVAQILDHPLVQARLKISANKNPRAMIWASLQAHTKRECPTVNYTSRIEPLLFSKDEASVWSIDVALAEDSLPEVIQSFKAFKHPLPAEQVNLRYKFTTFHQSFSYEDFIEGIKPKLEGEADGQIAYEIKDGIFKEICREASANYPKPYALFIDEINRGNVASIFGELITLIEDDKRLKRDNAMSVTLPYSRETFGVPDNLYLIGTMNTADRSVEALDTALRRRFTCEELKPDPKLIVQPEGLSVDLPKLFAVINARLEKLLDHDHCIGQAYFMKVGSLSDLRQVFANKIIPLLREYFYGHPAKIGMVLGEQFITRNEDDVKFAAGDWGVDSLDDKAVFCLTEPSGWTEDDFKSIYA